jgi:hypothetical protein
VYYPNQGKLDSFKCSEIGIYMNNIIRISKDFIVFEFSNNMKFIDIACNSQELDTKAKEFYANRKFEINDRLFVENKNIDEVDASKFKQI